MHRQQVGHEQPGPHLPKAACASERSSSLQWLWRIHSTAQHSTDYNVILQGSNCSMHCDLPVSEHSSGRLYRPCTSQDVFTAAAAVAAEQGHLIVASTYVGAAMPPVLPCPMRRCHANQDCVLIFSVRLPDAPVWHGSTRQFPAKAGVIPC